VAFSSGFDAVFSYGGTDISIFLKDVKFSPARKETALPVLGGNPVKHIVGPVVTMVDLQGFIDPTVTAVFSTKMAETTPTVGAVSYKPQGAAVGPTRTCNAFCVSYDEHTPSEGAGEFTAKLAVDGLVTFA
jgi:hypothetical protein